ncbi:MAG: hypothetical protein ACOCZC_02285 [Halodesulfurarchaeum sp.]
MISKERPDGLHRLSAESLETAIETLEMASSRLGFAAGYIPETAEGSRVREAQEAVRKMDEQLSRLRAEARRRQD